MGELYASPFSTAARALKGYRRGARMLGAVDGLQGKRVLDVGCGLGSGSWLLARRGARVTGVDVSQDAIEWARRTYSPEAARLGLRLEFWPVDLLAAEAGGLGEFDTLTVVDVLEHFTPGAGLGLLDRLRGLVAPGGRLFLHVPVTANALDWALVARNGLLRARLRGEVLDHHGDATHAARYSVRTLAAALAGSGWRTESIELRAYKPRLPLLEKSVRAQQWGPASAVQEQLVTDWDGIHVAR